MPSAKGKGKHQSGKKTRKRVRVETPPEKKLKDPEPVPKEEASAGADSGEVVEIRKYSNRRLYDTSSSRYVTLLELREMIRNGTQIRVHDAGTGQDLTRTVLLQIILENEQDMNLLPVSFLRQVIEAGSEAVTDSFRVTLTSSMEILSRLHEEFQSQVEEMTNLGAALPPLTLQWMSFMSKYFQSFANVPLPFDEPGEPSRAAGGRGPAGSAVSGPGPAKKSTKNKR